MKSGCHLQNEAACIPDQRLFEMLAFERRNVKSLFGGKDKWKSYLMIAFQRSAFGSEKLIY